MVQPHVMPMAVLFLSLLCVAQSSALFSLERYTNWNKKAFLPGQVIPMQVESVGTLTNSAYNELPFACQPLIPSPVEEKTFWSLFLATNMQSSPFRVCALHNTTAEEEEGDKGTCYKKFEKLPPFEGAMKGWSDRIFMNNPGSSLSPEENPLLLPAQERTRLTPIEMCHIEIDSESKAESIKRAVRSGTTYQFLIAGDPLMAPFMSRNGMDTYYQPGMKIGFSNKKNTLLYSHFRIIVYYEQDEDGNVRIDFAEIQGVADSVNSKIEVGAAISITHTVEWVCVDNPATGGTKPGSFNLAPTPTNIKTMSYLGMGGQMILFVILVTCVWVSVWGVLCNTEVYKEVNFCKGTSGGRHRQGRMYSKLPTDSPSGRRSSVNDAMGVNNIYDLSRLYHIKHLLESPPRPFLLAFVIGIGTTGMCVIFTLTVFAANGLLFRVRPESLLTFEASIWIVGSFFGSFASIAAYSWWGGETGTGHIGALSVLRTAFFHAFTIPVLLYIFALFINLLSGIPIGFENAVVAFLTILSGSLVMLVFSCTGGQCAACFCELIGTGEDRPGVAISRSMVNNFDALSPAWDVELQSIMPGVESSDSEGGVYSNEYEHGKEPPMYDKGQSIPTIEPVVFASGGHTPPPIVSDPWGTKKTCCCKTVNLANISLLIIEVIGVAFFLLASMPVILALCKMYFAAYFSVVPGTLIIACVLLIINFSLFVSYIAFQWIRRDIMWWHWVPFTMSFAMVFLFAIVVVFFVVTNSSGFFSFQELFLLVIRLFLICSVVASTIGTITSVALTILTFGIHQFTRTKASHQD